MWHYFVLLAAASPQSLQDFISDLEARDADHDIEETNEPLAITRENEDDDDANGNDDDDEEEEEEFLEELENYAELPQIGDKETKKALKAVEDYVDERFYLEDYQKYADSRYKYVSALEWKVAKQYMEIGFLFRS